MKRMSAVTEAVLRELQRVSCMEGKTMRMFRKPLNALVRRGYARVVDVGTRGDHIEAFEITEAGRNA